MLQSSRGLSKQTDKDIYDLSCGKQFLSEIPPLDPSVLLGMVSMSNHRLRDSEQSRTVRTMNPSSTEFTLSGANGLRINLSNRGSSEISQSERKVHAKGKVGVR
jgi:hypothetical protein